MHIYVTHQQVHQITIQIVMCHRICAVLKRLTCDATRKYRKKVKDGELKAIQIQMVVRDEVWNWHPVILVMKRNLGVTGGTKLEMEVNSLYIT